MKNIFTIMVWVFLFCACAAKRPMHDISTVPPSKRMSHQSNGFWKGVAGQMRFKKVTPNMEVQLEELMAQGCVPEYELLENDTAYMYSIIPGGGQIYTGEPKKALMYALSAFLIVPYLVSFEDAQSSVEYINVQYSIEYCKKKLRLSKRMEKRAKNRDFMNQIMQGHSQKKTAHP